MTQPLMPKATAVWLVDNTSLTFEQIGDFCGLHHLEVKGIADGDVAQGIKGLDPVAGGQLSREMIEKAQDDPNFKLNILKPVHDVPEQPKRKGPKYTPLSRRQERPDAIYWMVRSHPEVTDAQIAKLIGTTKPTIQAIRDRTHWNSPNLKPVDPVALGLCTQVELDAVVQKAAERKAKVDAKARKEAEKAGTILPTETTLAQDEIPTSSGAMPDAQIFRPVPIEQPLPTFNEDSGPAAEPEEEKEKEYDADSVFAGLDKKLSDESDDEA